MPPKKKKNKKAKQKGPPPPEPDPDEPFRRQIEETHYIPKPRLQSISETYLARIDLAIRAFTVAEPPILSGEDLNKREQRICSDTAKCVPLSIVPHVVRVLGLNPTEQQLKQLKWLVLLSKPEDSEENPNTTLTQRPSPRTLSSTSPQSRRETANSEDGWIMPEHFHNSWDDMRQDNPDEAPIADRAKLEAVLLDIMHTGLLVYDPTKVNSAEAAKLYPRRSATVLEHRNSETMEAVFDVLWKSIGQETSKDGVRLIESEGLSKFLRDAPKKESNLCGPLDIDELEDFILSVEDAGKDVIREDTFMITAMD